MKPKSASGRRRAVAYSRWRNMIVRCTDPTSVSWPWYGGRGITVCERWLDFATYYSDLGDAPEGTSLDRIDNDGPYALENVRWATPSEQAFNRRPRVRCVKGHEFTDENTYLDPRGKRQCRACKRAWQTTPHQRMLRRERARAR